MINSKLNLNDKVNLRVKFHVPMFRHAGISLIDLRDALTQIAPNGLKLRNGSFAQAAFAISISRSQIIHGDLWVYKQKVQ